MQKQKLEEEYFIYPVQPKVPVQEWIYHFVNPDSTIYNSDSLYPEIKAEVITDGFEHGYHVITVRFYPFEYMPKQKELYLCNICLENKWGLKCYRMGK